MSYERLEDTKGKIRGDKSKKGTQHRKLKSNTPPIRISCSCLTSVIIHVSS